MTHLYVIKDGEYAPLEVDSNGYLRVSALDTVTVADTWTPALVAEETLNDTDKALTVPTGKIYALVSVWVELTTTATVGNRQVTLRILDSSDDLVASIKAGAVQAASLTRFYLFAVGAADLLSFRDTQHLMTPMPPFVLPAGYKVQVWDSGEVDAAADDMVVQMMVLERAV